MSSKIQRRADPMTFFKIMSSAIKHFLFSVIKVFFSVQFFITFIDNRNKIIKK